uniref:Uncharacterized protein n=1 Tax=Hordeum vulgare subsp. vulgare TaxID=112509 RepID=A0A8I6XQW3_HORVV
MVQVRLWLLANLAPKITIQETEKMISLFWNCRGIGKRGMGTYISDLVRNFKLDFVGIQETMKKYFSPKFLRKIDLEKLSVGSGSLRKGSRVEYWEALEVIYLILLAVWRANIL